MSADYMTGARVPRNMVEERWAAVSAAMEREGLEALLVAGRGQIGQYGNVFYLSGLLPFNDVGHTYVFLRRGEEAQIVAGKRDQVVADVYAVEDLIWHAPVADMPAIGTGASALAPQISALIEKHGLTGERIGIVGMSRIMPVADLEAIRALQPAAEFVDADALLAPLKAVKSARELELYKDACEIADEGFQVLVEAMVPGATEAAIAAKVEESVRARGSLATIIHVLPGHVFTRPPTLRAVPENEMVHGYVECVAPNGYWVEKGTMFALGSVPDRSMEVYETLERAYVAGERLLRAGVSAADVARAVGAEAEAGGCTQGIWAGHGVGIDHDSPVLSVEDPTPLAEGMVISLHPHLYDGDYGGFTIDQYTITDGDPLRHSRFERKLYTVD